MTLADWPQGVNMRFYDLKRKPKENAKKVNILSGREVAYLINTRHIFEITASLRLSVEGGELSRFWAWFTDVLGGVAGAFTCPALGDRFYRFTDIPDPDTGRIYCNLSLSIEEVY